MAGVSSGYALLCTCATYIWVQECRMQTAAGRLRSCRQRLCHTSACPLSRSSAFFRVAAPSSVVTCLCKLAKSPSACKAWHSSASTLCPSSAHYIGNTGSHWRDLKYVRWRMGCRGVWPQAPQVEQMLSEKCGCSGEKHLHTWTNPERGWSWHKRKSLMKL